MQWIITIAIIVVAVIMAANKIYKTLTKPEECNCQCESCSMKKKCPNG